jgi:hypothetical protein
MATELVTVRHSLISDLVGALQEAMPWLEMHRDTEARELGADIRAFIRQTDREVAAGVKTLPGGQQ